MTLTGKQPPNLKMSLADPPSRITMNHCPLAFLCPMTIIEVDVIDHAVLKARLKKRHAHQTKPRWRNRLTAMSGFWRLHTDRRSRSCSSRRQVLKDYVLTVKRERPPVLILCQYLIPAHQMATLKPSKTQQSLTSAFANSPRANPTSQPGS